MLYCLLFQSCSSSDSSEDENIDADGVKRSKKVKVTIDEIFTGILEQQEKEENESDISSEEETVTDQTQESKLIDEEDVEFGNVSGKLMRMK